MRFHNLSGKSRSHGRGLAVIEMAFVLPVFLMLAFATITYGLALYNQAVITNASREAARAGIAFRVPAPSHEDITQTALAYCQEHLITFGSQVAPEVVIEEPAGRIPGEPLRVTVSYAYTGLALLKVLSPGPLAATATMIFE